MDQDFHSSSGKFLFDKELALIKFFESAPMMMGIAEIENNDIRHISDNEATASFFRRRKEEMEGKFSSELGVPQNIIELWISKYQEAEKIGVPVSFEYEHIESHKKIKYFTVTVTFLGKSQINISRFSYIVVDATDKRLAEIQLESKIKERTHELELQKNKFNCLLQSAPFGIAFLDNDLKYEIINPVLANLNGLSPDQHIGKTPLEIIPDYSSEILPALKEVVDKGLSVTNWEYESFTPADSDKPHTFLANYFPVKIQGETKGVGALVVDLTFKKDLENSLRTNEQRYKIVVDGIKEYGIIRMDLEGNIVEWNSGAVDIFGYSREEILGKSSTIIFTQEDLKNHVDLNERITAKRTEKSRR